MYNRREQKYSYAKGGDEHTCSGRKDGRVLHCNPGKQDTVYFSGKTGN